MSAYSPFEVQKAIDVALLANSIIASLCGDKIYSNPELIEDKQFPYIIIGDQTSNNWDTKTSNGMDVTTTLHCYSDTGNDEQCHDLLDAIYDTLHRGSLTLTTNELVKLSFDGFLKIVPEDSGRIYHGAIRFRALTTEI